MCTQQRMDGHLSCVDRDTGEGPSHRLACGGPSGEAPERSERSVGAEAERLRRPITRCRNGLCSRRR